MSLNVRNLAWLRSVKVEGIPDFGARLFETVSDIARGVDTLEQQTNSNLNGNPAPPPPLQGVTVTPSEAGVHISIAHEGEFYRGIEYHAEYADNPHFTNPFPVHMGPAREMDVATGSRTLYWRAFAQYQTGSLTSPVYHGGSTPSPVTGGSSSTLGSSQGSGTGRPGQGLQGYGALPWRGSKPPIRGQG